MRDAVIQRGSSVAETVPTPRQTTDRIADLRERREAATLEREVAALEQSAAMLRRSQHASALESWSDLEIVDRRDWMPTGFGLENGNYLSTQHDREDGRYSPFVENETDLALIRGMARLVTAATCSGVGIQNNLTNYVIGDGFSIEVSAKKHRISGISGSDERLIAAVQDVLDEFFEENRWWGDLDRELFWRSRRDGEFFLAIYPMPSGISRARVIEPEQVTEPSQRWSEQQIYEMFGEYIPHATNWDFGVHTADHDVQTVHGYSVGWDRSGTCDYLPKSIVEHFKVNVDRNVKRGMSDFYPAWKWLEKAEKIYRNTAEGSAIQAAIAFVREHAVGVTETQIDTMNAANAEYIRSRRTAGGNYRTENTQLYESGTVVDTPQGMQYKPGPLGHERGPVFVDVAQAILRYVGVRWGFPEWMINGDASNNNMASSITAESPFHRNVEAMQGGMATCFRSIFWRVVRNAVASARFSQFGEKGTFEAIKRQVELQIEPPQIDRREPDAETNRRVSLVGAGIMSKKTAQMEEGLDPRQEEENGLSASSPMQSPATPNSLFGISQSPTQQPQQASESHAHAVPTHARQAAIHAALESVETSDEARAILREVYP